MECSTCSTNSELKQTALFTSHKKAGAKLVDFAGYNMPLFFTNIISEHNHTRNNCSIFDVSHMGYIEIKGKNCFKFLQNLLTRDISKMTNLQASYSLICNNNGYPIDDLIVYKVEDENYFIVCNASNKEKVMDQLQKNITDNVIFKFINKTILAIQGPSSLKNVNKVFPNFDLGKKNYTLQKINSSLGEEILIAQTGYTGEKGVEIICNPQQSLKIYEAFLNFNDTQPAGLGARDTLRTEFGYCLFGNELTTDQNPYESRVGWAINLNEDFIGKDYLEKHKSDQQKKLFGLISENARAPRKDMILFDSNDKQIGIVTSGCFSPTLRKGIGIVKIDKNYPEDIIFLKIRDKKIKFYLKNFPLIKE